MDYLVKPHGGQYSQNGKTPELRCYNKAASQERVQGLNLACMERLVAWAVVSR